MNYRPLGLSDIRVSELSLGTSAIGGLNWLRGVSHGWPEIPDDAVLEAVRVAVDAGITHFDTADLYGNGRSERRLADAFHRLGLRSDSFIIASKVGYLSGSAPHPYDPFHIKHQCEQSLRNLRRDHIDLYYLHNADFGPDDRYLHPAAQALDDLVAAGKIRLKGQSAYSVADFEKTVPIVRPAVLQSRASALSDAFIRPDSPLQSLMERHSLTFIAFSPLQQGLLTGRYHPDTPPHFSDGDVRRNNVQFQPEFLRKLHPKLQILQARFGPSPDALASACIRFVLAHPRVSATLHGFQSPDDVRSCLHAATRHLSNDNLCFIRDTLSPLMS